MPTPRIKTGFALLLCGLLAGAPAPPSPDARELADLQASIGFDPDQGAIRRRDEAALARLARFLQRHPDRRLEIQGHTDPHGTAEFKLAQGAQYAATVQRWLVAKGVPPAQLETKSFGKERPRFRGPREALKNARCEFRLLVP